MERDYLKLRINESISEYTTTKFNQVHNFTPQQESSRNAYGMLDNNSNVIYVGTDVNQMS